MKKTLIIIPTYNEADNIVKLINEILALIIEDIVLELLIVDDNSADGTSSLVKGIKSERVHIIDREGKMGLGTAYILGFKYAIENNYDYVFEMDADFSHDPKALPGFFRKINDYDLVIGSRYTRMITFLPVKDVTAGFMCYKVSALKQINLDSVRSNGYSFQIEMKYRMWKRGFKIIEIPIVFIDRRAGVSKMSRKIVYEAAFLVWKLSFMSIFRKL